MRKVALIASTFLAEPKFWACVALAALPWGLMVLLGGAKFVALQGLTWLFVGLVLSVLLATALFIWIAPSRQAEWSPTEAAHDPFPATVLMTNYQPDPLESAVGVASGLHRLITRWARAGYQSRKHLGHAQDEVDRVIAEAEGAVLQIGNAFRAILANNAKQLEYATDLLAATAQSQVPAGTQAHESLPIHIEHLTTLYTNQTTRLVELANAVQGLVTRQQNARDSSQAMDILLDSVDRVSKEVSVAALELSVSGGSSGQAQTQRSLAEFADNLRQLADSSRDAVREMRRALEGIRGYTTETGRALLAAAGLLRKIANESRLDAGTIQNRMRLKLGETAEVVAKLNALSADNRGHINRIIVAMQFNDITAQKLQKVKNPLLSGVEQDLHSLFAETRAANRGFTDGLDELGNSGKTATLNLKPGEAAPKKAEVELF